MTDERKGRSFKVPVHDKRRGAAADAAAPEAADGSLPEGSDPVGAEKEKDGAGAEAAEHDFIEDLKRLQAEFDNYKKRMMREQTAMAQRASASLVERLLPVLDNFESAVEHGEGGPGIEMVYRELKKILAEEGLVEIEAEGALFDPTIHEAFQAYDDPDVTEPTVGNVLRRGYSFKNRVIRPAMVAVARPSEGEPEAEDAPDADDAPDAAEG
jgi:molecular chaperone GrpE